MIHEPFLIDGMPSEQVYRESPQFARLQEYGREIAARFYGDGGAKTVIGRWWRRRRLSQENQVLAQYGWNVDPDGTMHAVPVRRLAMELREDTSPAPQTSSPANPWHEGRIQIRAGYVVDTHRDNAIIPPSEMDKMKAQLG